MSRIIIFYSRTGNTKTIAEEYAGENKTAIYGIKDLVNRRGFFGVVKSAFHSFFKKATPIDEVSIDISAYNRVILCTPVWVGGIPSPVRTFLKKYGQLVNKVEYIITHKNHKKNYRKTMREMDRLLGKIHVREAHVITGKHKGQN
jgi:menaquinone-dependent protoporphyrinogen IX oxidase